MKFPRTMSSDDGDAHTSAVERLDEARDEQRRLVEEREAAEPGLRDEQAAADVNAAGDHVEAREAWAKWASRED